MSLLRDLRDRFSRRSSKSSDEVTNTATQAQPMAPPIAEVPQQSAEETLDAKTEPNPDGTYPNTMPLPRANLGPPPPGHQMQQPLQNAGMQIGMLDSMVGSNGPGMVDGMVGGMVAGGIVGQRIDQAKNHAYWKGRQQEYLAGNEAAVANPGVALTPREEKREERRKKRWSRRAN
jgi:hypothetical protein